MTSATRDELIGKLADIRDLSPDVRFGQLLANLGFLVEDQTYRSLWDVEDAELIAVMQKASRRLVAATAGRSLTCHPAAQGPRKLPHQAA